ncbi:unnamed protein product [Schistosoma turkestanicum]|nr:unnamed protein product [Schistosoma turkestanicum]
MTRKSFRSPLDLLHQSCERLLNECADRNRKPLKFRFNDINSIDINTNNNNNSNNCNYNDMNTLNHYVNELHSISPTCTVEMQRNTTTSSTITSTTTSTTACPNEVLDYSMKPITYHSYATTIPNPSFSTTTTSSLSSFPFSCFTSTAFKLANLPSNSLNDILSLLQQGVQAPETSSTSSSSNVNTLLQHQSTSSYSSIPYHISSMPLTKHDPPVSEHYFEYIKLLSNILNYLSLMKCFHTSNTPDCSNTLNHHHTTTINGMISSDQDRNV